MDEARSEAEDDTTTKPATTTEIIRLVDCENEKRGRTEVLRFEFYL